MVQELQRIPLEGASRVTLDVSGSHLAITWRNDVDDIIVSGQELTFERAGDELFLRAERRGRSGARSLFDRLPNISTPGVTIDWGAGGGSIEVSDEDGVKIRTGLSREGSSDHSPINITLPAAVAVTNAEVENGNLELSSPSGKVESQVKTGDFRSSGGEAELAASMGSGNAQVTGLAGSLTAMAGSGDVEITDCQGIVSVKAGSGQVSLSSVNGASIDVMAGSGDVATRHCSAAEFSCQTGSGDIDVVSGQLDRITVRSGSGDVECTAVFGPSDQSFTTGSGSVSLGVPRGLPARFEVATQGGDIDSEIQLVSVGQRGPRSRKTRRQVGSVGTGEPRAEVSVRTSSGDIKLHWLSAVAQPTLTIPDAPAPPEPPEPPAAPNPPVESESHGTEPQDTGGSPSADPRQEILEALASGLITVEEADALLEKIEGTGTG